MFRDEAVVTIAATVLLTVLLSAHHGKVFTSGNITRPQVGKNAQVKMVVMSVGPIPVNAYNY